MKYTFLNLLVAGLFGVNALAQVSVTPATVALKEGGNPQGFIRGSEPGKILFSTSEAGQPRTLFLNQIRDAGSIKLIRLTDRAEVLAPARGAFAGRNYLEAAKLFGEVADQYRLVLNIPGNFASEAKFYQIESLRQLGRFDLLAQMLDSPAGQTLDTMLDERYRAMLKMHRLWAIYGAGDMAKLESELAAYQQPVMGKKELLPAPGFVKMPQSELVQIAYLRAKIYESKGDDERALEDYCRAFSLTYAYEPFLAKLAMGAAMQIQAKNPALAGDNPPKKALHQMQSVAFFFNKRFPESTMPSQFEKFAVRPDVPVMISAPPEEEAPAEEKPTTGGDEADKGKGEEKGKAK